MTVDSTTADELPTEQTVHSVVAIDITSAFFSFLICYCLLLSHQVHVLDDSGANFQLFTGIFILFVIIIRNNYTR